LLQTRTGHSLAKSALKDEILLQPADLLVEQIVRLVNETEGHDGDDLRRAGLAKFAIGFVGRLGLASQLADIASFLGIFFLDWLIPDTEEVAVIDE